MTFRPWLPLALLLGSAGVCAQPYGPGGAPYAMPPGVGGMPMMPQTAPTRPQGQTARKAAPADRDAARAALIARSPALQATATLKEGIDKLLDFMGQDEAPNKLQVAAFLDREIAPYFDFDYMARWVAGPTWARMDPAKRTAMAARLEEGFLTALGGQLASYKGQQVKMLRPRKGARGAVSVNVGILRPGSYPAKMEFRMYKSDEGWKVYDVVANGRSAASYYRTRFQRMGMGQN